MYCVTITTTGINTYLDFWLYVLFVFKNKGDVDYTDIVIWVGVLHIMGKLMT